MNFTTCDNRADGNYTKMGHYSATTDNLTWTESERWLGKLKFKLSISSTVCVRVGSYQSFLLRSEFVLGICDLQ